MPSPDIWNDAERYRRWLDNPGWHNRLPASPEAPSDQSTTLVSVVVAPDLSQVSLMADLIKSLESQTHSHWELAVIPTSDTAQRRWLHSYRRRFWFRLPGGNRASGRIFVPPRRNRIDDGHSRGEPTALQAGLASVSGDMVLVVTPATRLEPDALALMVGAFHQGGPHGLLYTDSDEVGVDGMRLHPSFRPSWSPELLLSWNYIGSVAAFGRGLLASGIPPVALRAELEPAHLHDLWLRLSEIADQVVHIPRILYHQAAAEDPHQDGSAGTSERPSPDPRRADRSILSSATVQAVDDALSRRGDQASATATAVPLNGPSEQAVVWIRRRATRPVKASVIIPFRDQPRMLRQCIESLWRHPGHDDFELMLMDNDSAEPETMALLDRYRSNDRVRILPAPGSFNWSVINNAAASEAKGEVLVFLNNDIEVRSAGWLAQMVGQALRDDVGAVGARLLYPDGNVQHAGVVIGLGLTTHVFRGAEPSGMGYLGMARLARDVSAVTGAALASRREVFDSSGGFAESMALGYNDIDYCLRLGSAGLRIVYDPVVEMLHHESPTRGLSEEPDEIKQFFARWGNMVKSGDPFYNPNLSHFGEVMTVPDHSEEATWNEFLSRFDRLSRT